MSRSARSVKREIQSINRGIRDYQHETGETVLWYEFDTVTSTKDDVYDEGPSRRWHPAKRVPAVFVYFTEGPEVPDPDTGLYITSTAHFTVSIDMLRKAEISEPENTDAHMNDRFSFNNRLYSIDRYEKQGFVHNHWLTVAVDGHEVKDDEMMTDAADWGGPPSPPVDNVIDGGSAGTIVFNDVLNTGGAS